MPCLIKLSGWLKMKSRNYDFYSFLSTSSVLLKTEIKRFFTIDKLLVTAQASAHLQPPVRLAIFARDATTWARIEVIVNRSHFVVDKNTNALRWSRQTVVWHWCLHSAQRSCSSWFAVFCPHCKSMCLSLVSKGLPSMHFELDSN